MISIYLFYFLEFILVFISLVFVCFIPIYIKEKDKLDPEVFLGPKYNSFFRALLFYTKKFKRWLLLPFMIYLVPIVFGFDVFDYFSRIIFVTQYNNQVSASEKVVLLTQTLPDGRDISTFGDRAIVNNSQSKLLLKRHEYSEKFSFGNGGQEIVINPNTVFYCIDRYPDYILRDAPTKISTQGEGSTPHRWSLTVIE